MKVMFLFRSLLNSIKSLTQITKKIFMVIVVFGIIFGVFISVIDKNRVVIDPQKEILAQRAQIYGTLKQLNGSNQKSQALAFKTYNCITMGEACTDNPSDGDKNNKNTVIGMVTDMMALPYINPPASGTLYALEKFNDAGIFPNTYAAGPEGLGFTSLKIFQPIWEVFRNLTFLLLVVIIVVIGFMIMFRMKLDPHTVVSLENALPKIILTMVLITFSYAIAGFLIDLMYVSVILIINVLAKPGGYSDNVNSIVSSFLTHDLLSAQFPNGTAFTSMFSIYFTGIYAILDILPPILRGLVNIVFGLIGVLIVLRIVNFLALPLSNMFGKFAVNGNVIFAGATFEIGSLLGFLVAAVLGFFLSSIIFSIAIAIIVLLGLILLLMRIFFVLLASYIQILIQILFSPLLLLMEAIPGQKGFMPWIRNLVGNLSVFPVTIGLLLIIYIINTKIGHVAGPSLMPSLDQGISGTFGTQYADTNNQQMFLPPLMVLTPQAFLAVIDAAFLVMIPDLLKLIKQKIIGQEGGLNVGPGSLISGSIGGVVGGGIGMFSQFGSFGHGLGGVGAIAEKLNLKIPGIGGGGAHAKKDEST